MLKYVFKIKINKLERIENTRKCRVFLSAFKEKKIFKAKRESSERRYQENTELIRQRTVNISKQYIPGFRSTELITAH